MDLKFWLVLTEVALNLGRQDRRIYHGSQHNTNGNRKEVKISLGVETVC